MPGLKLDLSDVTEIVDIILKHYCDRVNNKYPNIWEFIKTDDGYSVYKYFKIIYYINKFKIEYLYTFKSSEKINSAYLNLVDKYMIDYYKNLYYDGYNGLKLDIQALIKNYGQMLFNDPNHDYKRWVNNNKKFTHPQIKLIINYWYYHNYSDVSGINYYYFLLSIKNIYGDKMPKKLKCTPEIYSIISQDFIEHLENIFNTNLIESYKKEIIKSAAISFIKALDSTTKDLAAEEITISTKSFRAIVEMPGFEEL